MGEKKARLKAFGARAAPIVEYVKLYQHALRALYKALPENIKDSLKSRLAVIGRSEIWPCLDGAIVLISQDSKSDITVAIKDPLNKTVDDFMKSSTASAYYDKDGKKAPVQAVISVKDASKAILHFADNKIESAGKIFRPNYDRGIIIGWGAKLESPDTQALDDFKSAFITKNFGGNEALNLSIQEEQKITRTKAERLIDKFTELLNTSEKEEDLQLFLKNHPEFLYPDFIECYPKFKLGEDYVTDYVLLVNGPQGSEYIFIEIERPNKEIFIKAGQFSADFTQAKDQILEWDNWLTKNHAYVSRKLPNFYKPQFHLVIGRDTNLTIENKEKIQSEFSATSRRFSTYDDLVKRFKTIVDHLLQP